MDHIGVPRHREPVPPQRWLAAAGAVLVMALAVGGSLGVLPGVALGETANDRGTDAAAQGKADGSSPITDDHTFQPSTPTESSAPETSASGGATSQPARDASDGTGSQAADEDAASPPAQEDAALPVRSGHGRRVVYDISAQRVWLVRANGSVARTYPVSGARNERMIAPGSYEVYSKSRHAVAYNYEETMAFMVRFAHGRHAPIGFHDIPRDLHQQLVQSRADLGTATSAGCVRQARPDALALWQFTDVGTTVVVVR